MLNPQCCQLLIVLRTRGNLGSIKPWASSWCFNTFHIFTSNLDESWCTSPLRYFSAKNMHASCNHQNSHDSPKWDAFRLQHPSVVTPDMSLPTKHCNRSRFQQSSDKSRSSTCAPCSSCMVYGFWIFWLVLFFFSVLAIVINMVYV